MEAREGSRGGRRACDVCGDAGRARGRGSCRRALWGAHGAGHGARTRVRALPPGAALHGAPHGPPRGDRAQTRAQHAPRRSSKGSEGSSSERSRREQWEQHGRGCAGGVVQLRDAGGGRGACGHGVRGRHAHGGRRAARARRCTRAPAASSELPRAQPHARSPAHRTQPCRCRCVQRQSCCTRRCAPFLLHQHQFVLLRFGVVSVRLTVVVLSVETGGWFYRPAEQTRAERVAELCAPARHHAVRREHTDFFDKCVPGGLLFVSSFFFSNTFLALCAHMSVVCVCMCGGTKQQQKSGCATG